eukprot:g1610.t1
MAEAGQGNVIEVVMPTYIMEPAEDAKFSPAEVKTVIDNALQEELKDKVYDEMEAKHWSTALCESIKAQHTSLLLF